MYAYRSSKAAVNMIGKSLANDLKDQGIAVQLWHPGYIATDMTASANSSGKRSVDDCIRGFLELVDKLNNAGVAETGLFFHANYGEGRKPIPW